MSTSKLQIAVGDMLDKTFPQYRIRENYRPDWLMSSNLTKLELDFYIEELKIAFEIQGAQHYEYIPYFHKSINEFEKRKQYDEEKKDLCYGAGIKLIELFTLMDALVAIKTIEEIMGRQQPLGEWLKLPPPKIKTPKIKKTKTPLDIIIKYQKDLNILKATGDPVASADDKIKELKQFHKKIERIIDGDKKCEAGIPYFHFKYLRLSEQIALFEEYEMLSEILPIAKNAFDLQNTTIQDASKIDEINKFYNKLRHARQKGKNEIPPFEFRYLSPDEQAALFKKIR